VQYAIILVIVAWVQICTAISARRRRRADITARREMQYAAPFEHRIGDA